MARLWLVRLGRHGEQEAHALASSELVLGFRVGDLSQAKNRDAVLEVARKSFADSKPNTQRHFAAQLNQFCNVAQEGDFVVVPLKTKRQIALGKIKGPYANLDGKPSRPVTWLKPDLPRSIFQPDLLYSFGAFMTVCEISRNNAVSRVEAILKSGKDPGFGANSTRTTQRSEEEIETESEDIDLAEIGRDQIEKYIASHFAGHGLTRLIAEILKAQNFVVNVSPPGPDKGVDIVGGQGALGLESPRIVVQVKSGIGDQQTLQALIGSVQDTKADYGLLVCWADFTSAVVARRNELYFRIRLWGREEIIEALLQVYDRLPEEIRAELPLRQVWTLVPEEDET